MMYKLSSIKTMGMVLGVLVSSSIAVADLLPTYQDLLEQRVRNDPRHYDHADQFCRRKNLGDDCKISGSALEGGGDGKCNLDLDGWGNRLIAKCELVSLPQIDRQLPDSPYELSSWLCKELKPKPGEQLKELITGKFLSCEPVPTVSDRFCVDRKPGDACTAQLTVNGKVVENPGVCQSQNDRLRLDESRISLERIPYVYLREQITRPSVLCVAKNRVEHAIRPSRPPGLLDWLHWPW